MKEKPAQETPLKLLQTGKLALVQKDCKKNPDMEIESAHPVGQEQVKLHGNSAEGQTAWSGFQDCWLQEDSSEQDQENSFGNRQVDVELAFLPNLPGRPPCQAIGVCSYLPNHPLQGTPEEALAGGRCPLPRGHSCSDCRSEMPASPFSGQGTTEEAEACKERKSPSQGGRTREEGCWPGATACVLQNLNLDGALEQMPPGAPEERPPSFSLSSATSPSKAALPEQLHVCQVAVEQLQHKRDGLSRMPNLRCKLEGQHQALEMLLQECQALKAQLRQSKVVTQEPEREHSLQIEQHQHMQEQLRQAETSVHILGSSLDLYKKKYRAALGRIGELESQMHHLQEEARRKAARRAEKLDNLWSSGQAQDSLRQLSAQEMRWAMQLTRQQDQTIQELQEQLAAGHSKLLQQKKTMASLCREFASYKLTHSCSDAKYRKQMVSQAIFCQKLQQAEEQGLQQQEEEEEAYQALVQELKLQLAREAEQHSSTLKDLARLEVAVRSLCQEAATEQSWQLRELAVLQHHACPVQALPEQSCEWKPDRLFFQRSWANCSIFWNQAHPSQEATQDRAASWPGGAPVLQPRSPEQSQKAAMEMAQDQPAERDLKLQCLGRLDCSLEVLLGRGCLAEAELEQKSFLVGDALPAAATSTTELCKQLMEELSRAKRQPLQAASVLELEMLRQQLQEAERRLQALRACMIEQKAESRSLQEQLTKQTAVLGLAHGCFRQALLQLQHQATEIESLRISLEASHAGHHWLHQESELMLADVRQWVKEQKQRNEELGHKLRTQIKQIAQLTGERDLLHQLLERLQADNQQLKNKVNKKRIVYERIKASAKNHQQRLVG